MTQATAVNLTGKVAPRLEFLRFVDNTLDSTDYLTVEVYNGSSWTAVRSWSGGNGNGNDNTWHAESINLAPYAAVTDFRVRFVTRVSLTDEHVHIDDIRITSLGGGCTDYRAIGSNDSLGTNLSTSVMMAEFPAGHFEAGACP